MGSKSRRLQIAKGPSQRQLRVGETIRHALSEILMREDFFDPDLANARVYTMPLGGVNVEAVLPALNRLAPLIQSLVAKKVHLRRTPRLRFYLDDSFENAARINHLFAAIQRGS